MILDASVHGYGGYWLSTPLAEPEIFVCPPPSGLPWDEQVHREMSAAILLSKPAAVRARGSIFIIVSDCIPVVAAIDHGSSNSQILQEGAEQIADITASYGASPVSLWVSGSAMIASGVDGTSRELAEGLHDTRSPDQLWALARDLARRHFWTEPHID
eukprot:2513774-Rhodomonas_salina.1